jgi:hypothetical protein
VDVLCTSCALLTLRFPLSKMVNLTPRILTPLSNLSSRSLRNSLTSSRITKLILRPRKSLLSTSHRSKLPLMILSSPLRLLEVNLTLLLVYVIGLRTLLFSTMYSPTWLLNRPRLNRPLSILKLLTPKKLLWKLKSLS